MNDELTILRQTIKWSSTGFIFIPFQTIYLGDKYLIIVNNFPKNTFYTLFKNNKLIYDFNEWLDNWIKSSAFSTATAICKNLFLLRNIFKVVDTK